MELRGLNTSAPLYSFQNFLFNCNDSMTTPKLAKGSPVNMHFLWLGEVYDTDKVTDRLRFWMWFIVFYFCNTLAISTRSLGKKLKTLPIEMQIGNGKRVFLSFTVSSVAISYCVGHLKFLLEDSREYLSCFISGLCMQCLWCDVIRCESANLLTSSVLFLLLISSYYCTVELLAVCDVSQFKLMLEGKQVKRDAGTV